jgi:hypothetical protein
MGLDVLAYSVRKYIPRKASSTMIWVHSSKVSADKLAARLCPRASGITTIYSKYVPALIYTVTSIF